MAARKNACIRLVVATSNTEMARGDYVNIGTKKCNYSNFLTAELNLRNLCKAKP